MSEEQATTAPWRDKAHRIIGALCADAYRQANPKKLKKPKPYTVPELASSLVDCLNRDDEVGAKQIFLSYEGLEVIRIKGPGNEVQNEACKRG